MEFNEWKDLVKEDYDLIELTKIISNKILVWQKLPEVITKWYSKEKKYILSFDIEFQNILENKFTTETVNYLNRSSYKFYRAINELGAIILGNYNDSWYIIMLFYVNMPILTDNYDKLFLLHSEYSGVSKKNNKNIIKLESKLLNYDKINKIVDNSVNMKDISADKKNKIYNLLISNNLFRILMTGKRIKELLDKDITFKRFYKHIKSIQFIINGVILKKLKLYDEYRIYKKINRYILSDKNVKARLVSDPKRFLQLFIQLLNKSFIIVKGDLDLIAIKNHCRNNFNIKKLTIFDIATYNDKFHKLCNSAELAQNIQCLHDLDVIKKFYSDLLLPYNYLQNNIYNLGHSKAHNPLTDAFFTWVIYTIISDKKKSDQLFI